MQLHKGWALCRPEIWGDSFPNLQSLTMVNDDRRFELENDDIKMGRVQTRIIQFL